MSKKITNVIVSIILIFICYEMLTEPTLVMESAKNAYNIWITNVFPALFPFFVISSILIGMNFPKVIGEISKPIMNKLFKIKSDTAFIFIMSLISGSPSNAKYTKELYENNNISLDDANKILMFSYFSSPLFILGTTSLLLKSKKIGIYILIIHYITNVLIGIFLRNYKPSKDNTTKTSLKNIINEISNNTNNISKTITKSIVDSINTIIMILGVITVSTILISIITNNLQINELSKAIISGLIEMTNGLKSVSSLELSLKLKSTISIFFISFGGLSIHLQILSIINDTNIKYNSFLIARIIHAIISSILCYTLFDIFI